MALSKNQRRPWTFMVYMAGDNGRMFDTDFGRMRLMAEMTTAGYHDLIEMGRVGSTDRVAVTCLFDTLEGAFLIEVKKGRGFADSSVRPIREVNTGDPTTLREFLLRSMKAYPAERYALVFWNHGTGWVDQDVYAGVRVEDGVRPRRSPIFRTTAIALANEAKIRPIAFDDSARDFLDAADLKRALTQVTNTTGNRFDIIGMDACLMSMIEGARELAQFGDYFIASEEVEPMSGWAYAGILNAMNAEPAQSTEALAKRIVREYAQSYSGAIRQEETVTQAAIALARTQATEKLCGELVKAILADASPALRRAIMQARQDSVSFQDPDYVDLGDFARCLARGTAWFDSPAIRDLASRLVAHLESRGNDGPVVAVAYRQEYERATGLSVYIPAGGGSSVDAAAMRSYQQLGFVSATRWHRFLEWLQSGRTDTEATTRVANGGRRMEFRRDLAVDTLRSVADSLRDQWNLLTPSTREGVESLVCKYGPELATVPSSNVAEQAARLLNELWTLRRSLPVGTARLLSAATGSSSDFLVRVEADQRQRLLSSLAGLYDFRVFVDPTTLARELSTVVDQHKERLPSSERAAWLALDAAYHQGGDGTEYIRGVERLLVGKIETVDELLARNKTWRKEAFRQAPVSTQEILASSEPKVAATALSRHVSAHFPGTVFLTQKQVPLVVHVARQLEAGGANGIGEPVSTAMQPGDLQLVLHAEDFAIAHAIGGSPTQYGLAIRTVQVTSDRDCEPVVFFLDPVRSGTKRIAVDLYQSNQRIATIDFNCEVIARKAISELNDVQVTPVPLPAVPRVTIPADLELRVTLSGDHRTLSFMLHSPASNEYHFQPAGQVTLNSDPVAYLTRSLERLSGMARRPARGKSQKDAGIHEELVDLGVNLYSELFPAILKAEYGKFRKGLAGKTLLVTSDEPWIPWELIKPVEYDANGTLLFADPFMCEGFEMARWLSGRGAPDRLAIERGSIIVPPGELSAATQEIELFASLHRRNWNVSIGEQLSTVAAVTDQFKRGDCQLYHFACHGNFEPVDADGSKLRLSDGYLTPRAITGDKQAGLRRSKPLVFLNACESGEGGFTLTRIGGWSQRFLDSGASAFIGTLWEVNDVLAARFATEFYSRLLGLNGGSRKSLGCAFREARLAVKAADPGNPTWLAYVLYGDPQAVVSLGQH